MSERYVRHHLDGKVPAHVGPWRGTRSICWREESDPDPFVGSEERFKLRVVRLSDVPLRARKTGPGPYPSCGHVNWPITEPYVATWDPEGHEGLVLAKYRCERCGFYWSRWFQPLSALDPWEEYKTLDRKSVV